MDSPDSPDSPDSTRLLDLWTSLTSSGRASGRLPRQPQNLQDAPRSPPRGFRKAPRGHSC
eukprot:1973022-Pyramimonas_sp.AAC.2